MAKKKSKATDDTKKRNSKLDAEMQKWREEDDARTLADAAAIKADQDRMANAKKAAGRLAPEANEQADDAAARAKQLNRLAK